MALTFQKAKREKLWVKILLSGVSGSGKTYSALRLAKGIAEACGSGIAYVDTENRRAAYYANEFDFDVIDMAEPHTPEKYMEAIDAAVEAGYKVLVIDSLSHEWKYLNETHDKMPGNSFTNWGPLKARHARLMEKILQSHIHIIATARGKDAYVMEDKNGKQIPKKVAEGIIGDKELEYNYTCTFQLQQDTHVASPMKDNTHVFEGRYDVLTEKDGKNIYDWANSGGAVVQPPKIEFESEKPEAPSEIDSLKAQISEIAQTLANAGVNKIEIANAVKSHLTVNGKPSANYNAVKDVDVAKAILEELNKLNA